MSLGFSWSKKALIDSKANYLPVMDLIRVDDWNRKSRKLKYV